MDLNKEFALPEEPTYELSRLNYGRDLGMFLSIGPPSLTSKKSSLIIRQL